MDQSAPVNIGEEMDVVAHTLAVAKLLRKHADQAKAEGNIEGPNGYRALLYRAAVNERIARAFEEVKSREEASKVIEFKPIRRRVHSDDAT